MSKFNWKKELPEGVTFETVKQDAKKLIDNISDFIKAFNMASGHANYKKVAWCSGLSAGCVGVSVLFATGGGALIFLGLAGVLGYGANKYYQPMRAQVEENLQTVKAKRTATVQPQVV